MINRISTVSVVVSDQDRALASYSEKLGLELHMDAPWGWWATMKDPDGNIIGLQRALADG